MAVELPPVTLGELIVRAAEHPRGQREGLRFVDRRERASHHPWREVAGRAGRVAVALAERGTEPGECVGLVLGTGLEFFDAFFGVVLAGAVPAPLYPPPRFGDPQEWTERSARMLAAVGARRVLTEERLRATVEMAAVAGSEVQAVAGLREATPEGSAPLEAEWLLSGATRGPDDLALVQFSSGTTLDPKPVALSHRALFTQARLLGALFPDRDGLRQSGVSWLPLYHDMGLIGCVLPSLERPADLTLLAPELFVARPALWLRTLSRYRATVSPAPNFAYALCVERIRDAELDGVDLSSWQVAFDGAETVVPEVARHFVERFAPWGLREEALTPVYGLAEAALAVTASPVDRRFSSRRFDREALARGHAVAAGAPDSRDGVELVSLGAPVDGFAVEIRDPHGRRCPSGRIGRVWARGPSLMSGYLGRPRESAETLRDGWLDTGDLGFLLDGELYLTGRAKDVLLLRGRNHAPESVEQAASRVAGVRAGSAVAVSERPEGEAEERLVVLVERRRDVEIEPAELTRLVHERVLVEVGLRCAEVVVLEPGGLPRTSSGKLRRAEALRRWRRGDLVAVATTAPSALREGS